jgi:hypothetical protein
VLAYEAVMVHEAKAVMVHEAKDKAVEGEDLESRDNKSKTYTASSKSPEMKFIPHRIGKEVCRQPLTKPLRTTSYNCCRSHLENGKDIADSIRKMDRIDMTSKIPVRKLSRVTDADDKATEKEGYNILNKAEIDMYTKSTS